MAHGLSCAASNIEVQPRVKNVSLFERVAAMVENTCDSPHKIRPFTGSMAITYRLGLLALTITGTALAGYAEISVEVPSL